MDNYDFRELANSSRDIVFYARAAYCAAVNIAVISTTHPDKPICEYDLVRVNYAFTKAIQILQDKMTSLKIAKRDVMKLKPGSTPEDTANTHDLARKHVERHVNVLRMEAYMEETDISALQHSSLQALKNSIAQIEAELAKEENAFIVINNASVAKPPVSDINAHNVEDSPSEITNTRPFHERLE